MLNSRMNTNIQYNSQCYHKIHNLHLMLLKVRSHIFQLFGQSLSTVVVVGPTPPLKNDGGVQPPFLYTPADGIPPLTVITSHGPFLSYLYGSANIGIGNQAPY